MFKIFESKINRCSFYSNTEIRDGKFVQKSVVFGVKYDLSKGASFCQRPTIRLVGSRFRCLQNFL